METDIFVAPPVTLGSMLESTGDAEDVTADRHPAIPDPVADFVYLRLQKGKDDIKTGYLPKALDQWAERAKAWAKGGVPKDLELIDPKSKAKAEPRDVFVYFIHEGKVRAPAAAMELIKRL
jgi:uncharacterized protein YecE (DUF72 family)